MRSTFQLSELMSYLEMESFLIQYPHHYQDVTIEGFSAITNPKPGTLTWMRDSTTDWENLTASVVICPLDCQPPKDLKCVFIKVENPRFVFTKILDTFHSEQLQPQIDETAIISDTCEIGDNVYIGPYVVIGDDVTVGDGTIIHSHVTLYPNTVINKNCVIHSGCVIGGDGFGYETDNNNTPAKIKHIGGVMIEDNVEIGSNSCIDRGTLDHTIIGENTKISNLCNISHNVVIGRNTMIAAKASVNGSTKIGDHAWISPGAIINNGLKLGKGCTVGLGAVVINDVKQSDVVAGVPARSLKDKT